jgi:serine/threonine-protein kinase HipA
MNRSGNVFVKDVFCGIIYETENGYFFSYDKNYLENPLAEAVSSTLPLSNSTYSSKTLFAFFDGLIPEGWLLNIAEMNWKINHKDRMGLLLACCKDSIGAVSIIANEKL